MEGLMNKKILVYIYDDMADFEVTLLCHMLGVDSGYEVITISSDMTVKTSKCGIAYLPKMTIGDFTHSKIKVDGIIIPGGWHFGTNHELSSLLKKLNDDQKLIAAICAAPWMLAVSGVLGTHRYTTSIESWSNEQKSVFGVDNPFDWVYYRDQRVVVDENIITAKGYAFVDFSIAVCSYLNLFKNDAEIIEFRESITGIS
jgi:putative intracellular protease/amidase